MSEIQVYARFRPLSARGSRYEPLVIHSDTIKVSVGDKRAERFAGSHYNEHSFKFKKVFDELATQEDVFNNVAIEMIDRFLEGFNGTLFAYGQTASGKTYTIEGGARQYKERGLIPRAISYIYSALESRKQEAVEEESSVNTIHISYLEIYQDIGYDLLNPGCRNDGLLLNLPKVVVSEGPTGEVFIRNLSSHLASNEEVALSLLFQGSTCRRVAETSMNLSSSRSHAIFTFTLTSQKRGSETRTRSKLNLVDLAGSERVYKTSATGQVLQEAKHINLSLHHLEHVIVVLQRQFNACRSQPVTPSSSTDTVSSRQSSRGFVPYRNSLLTMVLRDSLGGNCITAMISNLSLDKVNLLETVSTCRFAQRVACISNKARRNEELDDKVVIIKLKEKILQLQQEIEVLKGNAASKERHDISSATMLVDKQKQKCHQVLHDFLHGKVGDPVVEGINNPLMFTEALMVLKDVILHTVKENKKYKQHVNECSGSIPQSKPISLPLSTSISPQSQISSGFISLKDDDLQESCHTESHKMNPNGSITVMTHRPIYNQINTAFQDRLVSSSSDLKRNQTSVAVLTTENSKTSRIHYLEPQKHSTRKQVLSPEKNVRSVQQERLDLKAKVNNISLEVADEERPHLTTSKLSFQHDQLYRTELKQVIQEHKLKKLSSKLTQVKRASQPSQIQQQCTEKTDDSNLAALQKQLELKEAATRKRLDALKLELQSSSNTIEAIAVTGQYNLMSNTNKNNQPQTPVYEDKNDPPKEITTATEVKEVTRFKQSDKKKKVLNFKSPQPSSERLYSKALDKHKTRVNQIRQCIRAAIIIQRAWRKYKERGPE